MIQFPSILAGKAPTLDMRFNSGRMETIRSNGAIPSFSRASAATRINAQLQLEQVASGVMAHDWVPALGGWAARFEEQKTNVFQQSENFGTTPWSYTNSSVATDANTPFPGFNGFFLKEDSTTGNHNIASESIANTSGNYYTLSVFAKLGVGSRFLFLRSSNISNKGASFNLSTGTVAAMSAEFAGIQALWNGWYRCWITYLASGSGSASMIIGLASTAVTTLTPYAGDNTSGNYIFGAQFESGGNSSYIQTSGSSAVRQGDSLGIPTIGWWSQYAGTFLIEAGIYPGSLTLVRRYAWYLNDTGNNRLANAMALNPSPNTPAFDIGDGTATDAIIASNTVPGSVEKMICSYSASGSRFVRNGEIVDRTRVYAGTILTPVWIGGFSSTQSLNGYVKRFRYWNEMISAQRSSDLTK